MYISVIKNKTKHCTLVEIFTKYCPAFKTHCIASLPPSLLMKEF